jgi:hypothetical protein
MVGRRRHFVNPSVGQQFHSNGHQLRDAVFANAGADVRVNDGTQRIVVTPIVH